MVLKLQLVRNDEVVLEVPLDVNNRDPDEVRNLLGMAERDIERAHEIHGIFASRTRMRMLDEMVRNFDRRFSELMEALDANQKIVSENLDRLREAGLVQRVARAPRDVHYIPSRLGFASLLTSAAMCRILDEIAEEIEKEVKT